MPEQPTVAVDFDGTLCEHCYPECGPPRPAVVEAVRILHAMGWRVIVQTCRAQTGGGDLGEVPPSDCRAFAFADMIEWLEKHEVPYDEIWTKPGKPHALAYLDDRGVAVPARESPTVKDLVVACLRLAHEAESHHGIPTEVKAT